MHRVWNIWLAGGDLRQRKLAGLLARDGHGVHTWAMEQGERTEEEKKREEEDLSGLREADLLILPLPALNGEGELNAPLSGKRHRAEELFPYLEAGTVLCGGLMPEALRKQAEEKELFVMDYYERPELAMLNALPTAEGAIQIAMEELPITLCGARVLVVGCGRIGKLLAQQLRGLGAKVTVAARKYEQLAWAEVHGMESEHIYQWDGYLCGYDLVVNTAPGMVLGVEELSGLKEGCLVIDLASRPGGVDRAAAERLGVKVIWALSLPGRMSPTTAADAIRTAIYNFMREQEA